jgi:hypothetical protein
MDNKPNKKEICDERIKKSCVKYFEHIKSVSIIGAKMVLSLGALFVHAVAPPLCKDTAKDFLKIVVEDFEKL